MRKASMLVAGMIVAAAGCGENNDIGFYARGNIRASITQPGVDTPTNTGFEFNESTRIDPSVAAGGGGLSGTCQVGPNGRTVRMTRVGGDQQGLREVQIDLPAWEDRSNTCPRGSVTFAIGSTTFQGAEACGTAPATCNFTSIRRGSYGMDLNILCPQLRAPGDPRYVEFQVNLNLDQCDGPETRNPEP